MRKVTVVMAYYDQPQMLRRQLEMFAAYPDTLRENLELVIVDDGSPVHPVEFPACFQPKHALQVYRMDVDVRWNQDACRNLGAMHARYDWLLLTDLDHLIPEHTMHGVFTTRLDPKCAYKFSRVNDVTFDPYKVHPNTWLLTRELYERAGGYDERFAGYYGTDWDFRDRVHAAASRVQQLQYPVIRVGREHTPDASMPREFGRKTPEDSAAIRRLRDERGKRPPERNRFPNHRVFQWP